MDIQVSEQENREAKQLLEQSLLFALQQEIPDACTSILFASIAGSRSYNLNLPSSDSDLFGVYVFDSRHVLENLKDNSAFYKTISKAGDPSDIALYELLTFANLLLEGNPKIVETLFQKDLTFSQNEGKWEEIKKYSALFITTKVIDQYLGFIKRQKMHFEKGKGDKIKKFYHIVRLLNELERIVNGEMPKVWITGAEREYLMDIRLQKVSESELFADTDKKLDIIKKNIETENFREQFNANKSEEVLKTILNAWIIGIRRETIPRSIMPEITSNNLHFVEANALLRESNIVGRIIFAGISGKYLHTSRLNSPKSPLDSDLVDKIAVYVAPTDQFLGILPPVLRISSQIVPDIRDTYCKGMVIYEIKSICSQIQQGNHRILEILFSENNDNFEATEWVELKTHRNEFVTEAVLNHYQGVGKGQLNSLLPIPQYKGKLLKKKLQKMKISDCSGIIDSVENRIIIYQSSRLLLFGKRLLTEKNTFPVYFYPENADDLKVISILSALDGTSISDAIQFANSLSDQIDELKKVTKLPPVHRQYELRYVETLQNWLWVVRKNN